jgi:2-dehydropantoate 2-reductase
MRLLVVGAGATGGYFGGRLAQAGRDVVFLVRGRRAEQLARDGLRIVSPHGDATIHPKVVTADRVEGPFDAVLLTVKAFALEAAVKDVAPAVGPATMIVPVLNGTRHLDVLTAQFGADAVLGGVCIVATTLDNDGSIVQLAPMQELAYGERDGTLSPRVERLHAAIAGAGFTARASSTIMQEMWEKWVFLASLGGITCLLRGTVGDIEAVPGGADLALRLLRECAEVARASGFAPREDFMARTTGALSARGSGLASSMYRDLQRGTPVEVDHILADLLARARSFGQDAPLLAAAVAQLSIYQGRLSGA